MVNSDIYKITLQIVEDFIGNDYDDFIKNGPSDDIKLIKWELVIYFKKLEGKKKSIVEYYIIPIYKHIKESFYSMSNGRYMYIGNANNYYNTLTIDFEKNIPDKTITLKFICDETHKTTYLYLDQIHYILGRLMKDNGLMCNDDNTRGYYKTSEEKKENNINLLEGKQISLRNIVKNHYKNILINFESYITYCKTNGIDIDIEKINERIRYIKEYVKNNYIKYDITLD